jgi:hypothetical protein
MSLPSVRNGFASPNLVALGPRTGDLTALLRQQLIGSIALVLGAAAIAGLAASGAPYGEAAGLAQRVAALQATDLPAGRVSPADMPAIFRQFTP